MSMAQAKQHQMSQTANNESQNPTTEPQPIRSYRDEKLGPKFAKLVLERQILSEQIKMYKVSKDLISESLLGPMLSSKLDAVMVESYRVDVIRNHSEKLNQEKLKQNLLELGVDGDVIDTAFEDATDDVDGDPYVKVTDTEKAAKTRQEKKAKVTPIKSGKAVKRVTAAKTSGYGKGKKGGKKK